MADLLGVMYDFVQMHAKRCADIPPLRDEQILRGWQNLATLPADTPEFCVLSMVRSVRHGMPCDIPKITKCSYSSQLHCVMEHVVQADFCSASPITDPQITETRANLLHMVCVSGISGEFLKRSSGGTLAMLYADDVQSAAFLDPDSSYTARYFFQMHITEIVQSELFKVGSFDSVRIRTGRAPPEGPVAIVKNADTFFKTY